MPTLHLLDATLLANYHQITQMMAGLMKQLFKTLKTDGNIQPPSDVDQTHFFEHFASYLIVILFFLSNHSLKIYLKNPSFFFSFSTRQDEIFIHACK